MMNMKSLTRKHFIDHKYMTLIQTHRKLTDTERTCQTQNTATSVVINTRRDILLLYDLPGRHVSPPSC